MNSAAVTPGGARQAVTAAIDHEQKTGYYGCVEGINEAGVITGWAINAEKPQQTLSIGIYADGELVGTAYCTDRRADLAALLRRPSRAGFTLPVSMLDLPARLAEQRDARLEFAIEGTPFRLPLLNGGDLDVAALSPFLGLRSGAMLSEAAATAEIARYVDELDLPEPAEAEVKAIAFYLPQFHPIPENDRWWGPGFTEWTNVTQAKPLYPGHQQPRIPGELGFYDLRLPEVREAQAQLAREYGIHGFCYYYYWFGGRRVLERPLDEVLASGKPDFPFCICWANETWSRRWDGSEHEVLLKQEHTPATDMAFILDVIPILKDPRYIRVDGAPLLMVYRTCLFPDMKSTAEVWRRICAEHGLDRIHLCAVESFGFNDPYSIGFDSSVQFPPHGIRATDIRGEIEGLDPEFEGSLYDYEEVVENELVAAQPSYKRFRGVMLSWDNSARRKKRAHVFHNASWRAYEVWLRGAVEYTRAHRGKGERYVFINAWNEWAEGTHLEPDVRNGRRYLEATRRALMGESDPRTLIEYARAKGDLDGQELSDWLAEMEAGLERMERMERHAKRLASRQQEAGAHATAMAAVAPYIVEQLPMVNTAQAYFDRVGACGNDAPVVDARRTEAMYVDGWCVYPGAAAAVNTVSYLVLESVREKHRYYATLFGRRVRDDVAASMADVPDAQSRYSGFRSYVDLAMVPQGEYRLGLIQLARASFAINFHEGVVRVV